MGFSYANSFATNLFLHVIVTQAIIRIAQRGKEQNFNSHHTPTSSDDLCCCFAHDPEDPSFKIVYRHYATLYFIFLIDEAESELGVLDLLQVFVQVLDTCFENVCELDLIYHFDRVNYILDELVMAGMVLETSIDSILTAVNDAKKLETEENSVWGFEVPAALR